MKLDPKFKKEWLAALRSGDYEQGQEQLRYENEDGIYEHCCLGVATDILIKTGRVKTSWSKLYLETTVINGEYHKFQDGKNTLSSCSFIPVSIANKIGLAPYYAERLAELNDESGWNFDQIADYIEENM